MTIRIEGLSALIRDLEKAGASVQDLRAPMNRIAELGARTAEALAPRRSGRLARSHRPSNSKNKATVAAGGKSKGVPYAGVVRFSRKNGRTPNRWMERTSDLVEPVAGEILSNALEEIARRVAR